jgi:hypothetical protein
MAKIALLTNGVIANGTPIIDSLTTGIAVAGDYVLIKTDLDPSRLFLFGAKVAAAGHTATVQLFGSAAGAKTNVASAVVTPTNNSPAMAPDEYTLTGLKGFTVSGLTGSVYIEVVQ